MVQVLLSSILFFITPISATKDTFDFAKESLKLGLKKGSKNASVYL